MPLIRADGSLLAGLATRTALIHPLQVPLWIDLTAVVVSALAGAGIAARERFDVIGADLAAAMSRRQRAGRRRAAPLAEPWPEPS